MITSTLCQVQSRAEQSREEQGAAILTHFLLSAMSLSPVLPASLLLRLSDTQEGVPSSQWNTEHASVRHVFPSLLLLSALLRSFPPSLLAVFTSAERWHLFLIWNLCARERSRLSSWSFTQVLLWQRELSCLALPSQSANCLLFFPFFSPFIIIISNTCFFSVKIRFQPI